MLVHFFIILWSFALCTCVSKILLSFFLLPLLYHFHFYFLQVKRDYVEGMSDSLDLVPIGAWHGNGRKAGW